MTATRRGWYYGWNIVAVCILSQVAAMGLTFYTLSLFLRDWARDLHAPISELQLCMLALTLVGAAGGPLFGAAADRFSPRRLFGLGLVGIALFYLGMSWASSVFQVLILYGFCAVAAGICTAITANALISRWFVRHRGVALGLNAFGLGFGGVILPPIVAAALPDLGWRMIWRIGGAIVALVVAPLVVTVIRNRPTEREGLHYIDGEGAAAAAPAHGLHDSSGPIGWRDVVRSRNFWLMLCVFVPLNSSQGGVIQNLAPYAVSRGFSEQSAGLLLSLLNIAAITSTVVIGFLSDRVGNRAPLAGLAFSVAAGMFLLAFAQQFPMAVLGCILVGLGGGVYTPLAAGLAREFGAEGVGLAFGMCMIFVPLTALIAIGVARTLELTGSHTPALIALALVLATGGMLALLIRERPVDRLVPVLKPAH